MRKFSALFAILFSNYLFAQKFQNACEQLSSVNKEWKLQREISATVKNAEAKPLAEQQLLQFHLQETELLLRSRDISHLSPALKKQRAKSLDILHGYWQKGLFPVNDMHEGRQPYFIDKYKTYCAVGYLLQQTGADDIAREIAATQNYSYLKDITHPKLMNWAAHSGFTLDELALIQPAYVGGQHPVVLLEMHYNNVGADVNEYIEILESTGGTVPYFNFQEVLFYNEADVLYKTLNKSQMQQTILSNNRIRSYTFTQTENFADAGRIVIRNDPFSDLIRINYSATNITYSEFDIFSSGGPFSTKIFNVGESETTLVGKSISSCGIYKVPFATANLFQMIVSDASPLQINTCLTLPVPITLSIFEYSLFKQKVNLAWKTESESNSSFFYIERSENGINFEAIGKITAAGNSSTIKNYSFIDKAPNYINHYRLKGVDLDGKITYSKILFVKVPQANPLKVIVNPVVNNIQLQLSFEVSKVKTINIFDLMGRKVKSFSGIINLQKLNVANISLGKYILELHTTDGKMYSTQFVKVN